MDLTVNRLPTPATAPPQIGKLLPPAQQTSPSIGPELPAESKEKREVPLAQLSQETVKQLNEMLRERSRELEFSVDDSSGRTVVRVIHSESGEVIRQMPPEVVLRFAEAFTKGSASLLEDFA